MNGVVPFLGNVRKNWGVRDVLGAKKKKKDGKVEQNVDFRGRDKGKLGFPVSFWGKTEGKLGTSIHFWGYK